MTIKGQSPSQRLNSNTSLALGKNNGAILIQDEEGTLGGINPPQNGKSVLSFDSGLPDWKTLNELLEIPEPSASPAIFAVQNGAFVWIAPIAGPPGPPGPQGEQGIPGPAQSGRAVFASAGATTTAGDAAVEIQSVNDGNADAVMAFHVPGAIATNFGLNRQDGWMEIGGWSYPQGGAPLRVGQLSITGGGGVTFSDGTVQNTAISLGGINGPAAHWDGTYKWRHLGDWGPGDGAILVHRAFVADTANTANSTGNASGSAGPFTALAHIESQHVSNPGFQFHKPGIYGANLKLDDTNWLSTQGWSAGGGFTSMRVGNLQVNGGLYFPDGSVQTTAGSITWGPWQNIPVQNARAGAFIKFRRAGDLFQIVGTLIMDFSASPETKVIGITPAGFDVRCKFRGVSDYDFPSTGIETFATVKINQSSAKQITVTYTNSINNAGSSGKIVEFNHIFSGVD